MIKEEEKTTVTEEVEAILKGIKSLKNRKIKLPTQELERELENILLFTMTREDWFKREDEKCWL